MTGRPTKCTAVVAAAVAEALEQGNTVEVACACAGISASAYHSWRERGRAEVERVAEDHRRRVRQDEAPFVEFLERTTRARAEAEKARVKILLDAAGDDWRAALAWLEKAPSSSWHKAAIERNKASAPQVTQTQTQGQGQGGAEVVFYIPTNGRAKDGQDDAGDGET